MTYMFAVGPCFGCGAVFSFNPMRVPSIKSPASGELEPICATCVARCNPRRIANGLDPIIVLPDAYEFVDMDEHGP